MHKTRPAQGDKVLSSSTTTAQEVLPKVPWTPRQIYVLVLMLLVMMCNYMDRGLLALLQEPMKAELHLRDSQLGLLGGVVFGLLFALCSIPTARLAERMNRATLVSICIAFWSVTTAACGLAGNFTHLVFARMGVAAGEGGCIPISQSVLADTFSVRQRGIAMSVASAATPLANILSPLLAPLVVEAYGWRAGFFAFGVPGLLLALLVMFTLRDPRESNDTARAAAAAKGKGAFFSDMKWLLRSAPFMLVFCAGGAIGIGVTAVQVFKISFLVRVQGFTLSEAGALWSTAGLCGLAGTFVGGYIADKFADSRGRSYVLTPAVSCLFTFAAYAAAFTATNPLVAAGCLMASQFTYNMKNGPIFAAVQNIVPANMRSTGAAMHMLAATTIGAIVGPTVVGYLSDHYAAIAFGASVDQFFAACPGGKAPDASAASLVSVCSGASAMGLRQALLSGCAIFVAASAFLFLAARTIKIEAPD